MKHLNAFVIAALLTLGCVPAHADLIFKQSTASQAIKAGPFVSSTDGNTESTALTIANTDVKCSKNGGTLASKNSGGGTHDANGWYTITFDATDTNTVGRLQCFVHVAGALPVYIEGNVVEEAIYDGLYGTNAGTSTTILPVNTLQVNGTAQTARDLGTSVLLSSGTGTGQLSITSGVVNANAVQQAGTSLTTLTGSYPSLGIVDSGTAQAATGTTLQIRSAATFADNELSGASCIITGGTTGVGQSRTVSSSVGSTDTLTVPTWTTTPTGTITYVCYGTAPGAGGSAPTAAQVATAVWQDTISGDFTVSSSVGKSLYTSGATPGAAGGLLIAGTNADFDVTGNSSYSNGITITQATSNQPGFAVTGNGTGNGATFTSGSGATGNGLQATAASTNGNGIGLTATGSGVTQTITPANMTQIGSQTASASGTVTFPAATLASTTNITAGTITTVTNLTNAPTAGDLTATMKASVQTAVTGAQNIPTGTCSSGSTTTCTDVALTQSSATQLQDRLICFSDNWCGLVTTFNPGTDTVTTTKVAPTSRSGLTYQIFPSTTQ